MRVLVSGASGLVGTALVAALTQRGDDVVRLVRRPAKGTDEASWDPKGGRLDQEALERADAVINLSGENVGGGRWTDERKARIRQSRIDTTKLLAQRIAAAGKRPEVLINASAVGIYGDRGDQKLDERSPLGDGFLAEVCKDWEKEADAAAQAGVRLVKARIGVVLTSEGGALQKMLTPFKLGLGGRIGDGKQWMSWISLDDLVGQMLFSLDERSLKGAVNFVSPEPVTNATFTKTLGAVLRRPTVLPLPAFAARLALGEQADGLLLGGARVYPERLTTAGARFQHATLREALEAALGAKAS